MTATAPTIRPLTPILNQTINSQWLFSRAPIFILAIENGYNVFHYLKLTGTPDGVAFAGAMGFDAIFIGMIALSDQVYGEAEDNSLTPEDKVRMAKRDAYLFWAINIGALLAALLFGLAAHNAGTLNNLTIDVWNRALWFPVLSLLYNFYFERKSQLIKAQLRIEQLKVLEYERANPYVCDPGCGRRFNDQWKRNGHMGQCPAARAAKQPVTGPTQPLNNP